MELIDLLLKQKHLDDYIAKEKDIIEKIGGEKLINDKATALMVESGELLNEIRGFKYWSSKGMTLDKARKEYIDCFHFMLGLGLDLFNDLDRNDHTENYICDKAAEKIESFYDEKYIENIKRQKEDY